MNSTPQNSPRVRRQTMAYGTNWSGKAHNVLTMWYRQGLPEDTEGIESSDMGEVNYESRCPSFIQTWSCSHAETARCKLHGDLWCMQQDLLHQLKNSMHLLRRRHSLSPGLAKGSRVPPGQTVILAHRPQTIWTPFQGRTTLHVFEVKQILHLHVPGKDLLHIPDTVIGLLSHLTPHHATSFIVMWTTSSMWPQGVTLSLKNVYYKMSRIVGQRWGVSAGVLLEWMAEDQGLGEALSSGVTWVFGSRWPVDA